MWLLLVTLMLFHGPPPCTAALSLKLPTVTLDQLKSANADTLERVGDAIERYGMFTVTGLKDGSAAAEALQGFVGCVEDGKLDGQLNKVDMEDRTFRRTLATSTEASIPQPLPIAAVQNCPRFAQAATRLRAAVESVGQAYSRVLDILMYGDDACTSSAQCFASAVREAESLEHFHVFHRPTPVTTTTNAAATSTAAAAAEDTEDDGSILSMHSDIGLFLVMTPAQYYAAAGGADKGAVAVSGSTAKDLQVALRNGEVVEPSFPAGSLLVMNGEGLTRWMRPSAAGHVQPYSPMHQVLNKFMVDGRMRAWFGRMYFPARHAKLQVMGHDSSSSHSMTFHEYRQQTHNAFKNGQAALASTIGCTPSRRLLADEGSCGVDQVYCWMSCMNIPSSLTCSKSQMLCQNINTGQLWPQDYIIPGTGDANHCFDCALTCPASTQGNSTSPPAASRSSFCNTLLQPTTMWMTGFQFAHGNEKSPCVVFLFPEWVLDSEVKFGFACLGTFLIGILIGSLTKIRLIMQHRWLVEGSWNECGCFGSNTTLIVFAAQGTIILIIAIQVMLGYWMMLVAMTYQAELFIMVILGLACGHLFNLPRPNVRNASKKADSKDMEEPLEPCCAA